MKTASETAPAARSRIAGGAERVPEWAAEAVELAESGWTRTAIAARFGVSVSRVSFVLKRCGLGAGWPGRRPSAAVAERRARVGELIPRHSIEEVARREGVAAKTIWSDVDELARQGVLEKRPRGYRLDFDAAAIEARDARGAARIQAGDSLEEIARDEGVDPTTIWRALKARGVRFRRPGRRPRYLVGDQRRRKTCERPGCEQTFVVYPCDEDRRHHCSDRCEALELWRTGRVSPQLLEGPGRGAMRSRWFGRWRGREAGKLGGRPRGYSEDQARRVLELRRGQPSSNGRPAKPLSIRAIARVAALSRRQVEAILAAHETVT